LNEYTLSFSSQVASGAHRWDLVYKSARFVVFLLEDVELSDEVRLIMKHFKVSADQYDTFKNTKEEFRSKN